MDGSKFATLILHIPNIFSPIAIISILPTQVIYVITVSFKILDSAPAPKAITPSYKNTAILESITPKPIDAAKKIEDTPSRIDFANNVECSPLKPLCIAPTTAIAPTQYNKLAETNPFDKLFAPSSKFSSLDNLLSISIPKLFKSLSISIS